MNERTNRSRNGQDGWAGGQAVRKAVRQSDKKVFFYHLDTNHMGKAGIDFFHI
jgi:hypothetical protein